MDKWASLEQDLALIFDSFSIIESFILLARDHEAAKTKDDASDALNKHFENELVISEEPADTAA
jgi:hypothetical protein